MNRNAKNYKYYKIEDGEGIIIVGKMPRFFISKSSKGRYYFVKFRILNAIKKKVEKLSSKNAGEFFDSMDGIFPSTYTQETIEEIWDLENSKVKKRLLKWMSKGAKSFLWLLKARGKELFYGLDKSIKDVLAEQIGVVSSVKVYDEVVIKGKVLPYVLVELTGGEITDSEDTDFFKHGKWKIRYEKDGRTNKEKIVKFFDDLTSKLKAKGLGKLCYGDVLMVRKMPRGLFADYEERLDSIRLKASLSNTQEELRNAIHELGHRYLAKFASKKLKQEVNHRFDTLGDVTLDKLGIEKGDIIIEHKSPKKERKFKVLLEKGDKVYVLCLESWAKKEVEEFFGIDVNVLASDSFSIEGKKKKTFDDSSFMISSYGLVDEEEFFCELFSYWVLNKLKGEAKDWFDNLGVK